MHYLEQYANNVYVFTHKKDFERNAKIFSEDRDECFDFAYDMTFGREGEHRDHRSGGIKKRKNGEIFVDTYQGKVAEFAFYNYFKGKVNNIEYPDMKREGSSKWDTCDFCVNTSEVAIKSTKSYGNLLLLETKDWNDFGEYIPNIGTGHENYDYFVLIRVKSKLKEIMVRNRWLYADYVERDELYDKLRSLFWEINIAGYITRDEFVNEVIRGKMIIKQKDKLGTNPFDTTEMDATNYYVQAGDLHEIGELVIEINRRDKK